MKPGWEATYDKKTWTERLHYRKHFVRLYQRFKEWQASATLYERFERKIGWGVEAPEPLLTYEVREATVLN